LRVRVARRGARQAQDLDYLLARHRLPAVLKNALDIASQPHGHSAWHGKPGAIVSVSPGAMGGFGANHHLRQALVFLNVPVLQQPEAYIGGADKLFDSEGRLDNENTARFLATFLGAFERWARRLPG
jgi:chromate reductase